MFVLEPAIVELAASPDDVLTLLTSLNKPMVALEDHPMDEGEATIWSVRRESDMVSTYVHLCLTGKKTGVFYRYEVDPYPDDLRGMVEGEALAFAESLGFIMDNTHYAELDAEERKQHLAAGPFEWTGTAEPLALEGDQPGVMESGAVDFGEAGREPEEGEPGVPGLLSDEEVDGAVRDLTGHAPAGRESTGADPADDEFERAVEEFITGGGDGVEPAAQSGPDITAAPGAPVPPATEGAVPFRGALSRFRRRPAHSDIYEIRGLARAPETRSAPEDGAPAPADASAPKETPAAAPVEPDAPSDLAVPGDSDTRRRRARARFLASF